MQEQVTPICLISPSKELVKLANKIINSNNKKIDVFVKKLDEALVFSKELISKGARIIISRKGTTEILKQDLDIPTVNIDTTLSDYISIMEKVIKVKGKIAFFSYSEISDDIKTMCYLLNIDADYYTFNTFKDCEICIKNAMAKGILLGIGGTSTEYFARKYGLNHIVVESSPTSVKKAIEVAEQLLKVKNREHIIQEKLKLKMERYKTIFNYTHDAIIAVDNTGKIEILNSLAAKIVKSDSKYCIGKDIKEVIHNTRLHDVTKSGIKETDEIMNINGTMVSTNRIPIIVDQQIKGVVATFQEIKSLQKSERKARVQLHKKGFVAKHNFDDIIGSSEQIKKIKKIAYNYSLSKFTILITGETGTGKELFAQSIHNTSPRKEGPFVAINCSALSKSILESELFGYEEGSFTGALKGGKQGVFELANGGTLFLDEVGEMPMEIQVKLLRALQENEIRRIGGESIIPINIRFIAATNKNLFNEIKEHRFREDLYYRLNVLNLTIPPLRDRKDDIIEIANNILNELNYENKSNIKIDFNSVFNKLNNYDWHGNVRELKSFVERLFVVSNEENRKSKIDDLINELIKQHTKIDKLDKHDQNDFDLTTFEKNNIIKTLMTNNLEIGKTAETLGYSRTTLWRKMKEYKINIKQKN